VVQTRVSQVIEEGRTQVGTVAARHSGLYPHSRRQRQGFFGVCTAINISPGGVLVAVRRSLPKSAPVSLEIPSAPIGPANGLRTSSQIMQAKAVWVTHLDDYHLLGLKFARPLNTDAAAVSGKHLRKTSSAV